MTFQETIVLIGMCIAAFAMPWIVVKIINKIADKVVLWIATKL